MTSFIAQLKAKLPESAWPVVVAALRGQPAVWAALQEQDFGARALEAADGEPACWSPAFLGLLALGEAQHFAALRDEPHQPAEEKLRRRAAAAYEALSIEGNAPTKESPDLAAAALLAIALRERHRLQQSWAELAADLSVAPPAFWILPLACFFGLLDDPAGMLAALFASEETGLQAAGLATLLSNPLSAERQVELLNQAAGHLELPAILALLRNLAAHRSPLAQSLAQQALQALPDSPAPRGDQLDQLHKMLIQSEIHQLSGQPEQALPLLNAAWEAAQDFQSTLAAKLAEAAGPDAGATSVGEDWVAENSGRRRKKPANLLSAARVAIKNGDHAEAQSMAAAALEALQANPQLDPAALPRLAELFLDLGQPAQAKQAAQIACLASPDDGYSALLLSRAEDALGDAAGTLEAAHLAAALQPDDVELRRHLAHRLEANGSGAEALAEWEAITAHSDAASNEDWLALAACALEAQQPARCIEACQHLIGEDGGHARAHALMGRALMLSGDTASAVDYLQRAAQLAPGDPEPWLALAAYQRQRGEADVALETLLAAAEAAPASARIQAALGEVYGSLEKTEDALAAYRQAHDLAALKPAENSALLEELALHIGQLQIDLGQSDEARATLEQAHQAYPANPHIARHVAHLLLDAGEPLPALSALTVARQALPDDPDIQMDTARAQLALGKDLEGTQAILTHLVKRQPERWVAQALLAETHQALGQSKQALRAFNALSRAVPEDQPEWTRRLGIGKAAAELDLDKVDEAIATLEALSKSAGDDLELQRALCSAYQRAGRADEAFQIARQVYLSSARDQASLIWYAEQAAALGKPAEAIGELSKAAKGDPELTLHLAELQWADDDPRAALDSFAQLLTGADVSSEQLGQAAAFLGEAGERTASLPYWQRAVEVVGLPNLDLLLAYSRAQADADSVEGALASLEAAIELAPNSPDLLAEKAGLQVRMDRPQAALLSLDQALEMLPGDAGLLARKAHLLASSQDWAAALDAAEAALSEDTAEDGLLEFTVELAADCLQPQRARALLEAHSTPSPTLACLDAELALDTDEELAAAQALAPALESDPEDLRVHALQARLDARRADRDAAERHYHAALKSLADQPEEAKTPSVQASVALAAIELEDWDTAIKLLEAAVQTRPHSARSQLALGRALVARAEWQGRCQAADAIHHAPGTEALDSANAEAAAYAFEAAARCAPFADAQAFIARWVARASLRFGETLDAVELPTGYPADSGEAAALVHAAGETDIKAIDERIQAFATAPDVQVELALHTAATDAESAYAMAAKAAGAAPGQALIQAIAARLAGAAGHPEEALGFINQALILWPNEPRWHAAAADLHQAAGRLPEAAHHLEQAAGLESQRAIHHAALGQVQLQSGEFTAAIRSLSQARDLDSQDALTLLALAQAHRGAGDLAQAKDCAAKAARLSAGQDVAALLLQGELSLQEGQPAKARERAEAALKRDPEDPSALRMLAEALAALGDIEEAIGVLEKAMQFASDPVPLQIRRAQLLPDSRAEGTLDTLIRLSQRYPKRADVFLALSEALALAGEFDDALQAAQHAVKHADQLDRDAQADLHLHFARLLKHFGQLDGALHQLDSALGLSAHLMDVHLERGQVFLARRQFEQAMDAFAEAAKAAPRYAEPHLQAGLALKEAKDYAAAEAELRQAAELAPKDAHIQRQLAGLIALNLVHQPEKIGV